MADTKALAARLGSAAAANQLIAQWAVNCVAYRDHNSIMIPFNYDGGHRLGLQAARPDHYRGHCLARPADAGPQDRGRSIPTSPAATTATGNYRLRWRADKPGYNRSTGAGSGLQPGLPPQRIPVHRVVQSLDGAGGAEPRSARRRHRRARTSGVLLTQTAAGGTRFARLAADHHRSVEERQCGRQRPDPRPGQSDATPDHRAGGLFRAQAWRDSHGCPAAYYALGAAGPDGDSPGPICRDRLGRADPESESRSRR